MRKIVLAMLVALCGATAHAAPPNAPAQGARSDTSPKVLGQYDDWTAATHNEGGQLVCYAFTRVSSTSPTLHGRGEVVLTVTERPSSRDAVAVMAGFAYPANAEVAMHVDRAILPFYTTQRSAFARDGAGVVAAFRGARTAAVHSPGPRGAKVVDNFSLRGFPLAYAAITRACPK